MTNAALDALNKTVHEIRSELGSINASLDSLSAKLSSFDIEESLLKTLQDEMTSEIDKEVMHQMILNDPGSKECKDLQRQKHIQEIKDAAKDYEL